MVSNGHFISRIDTRARSSTRTRASNYNGNIIVDSRGKNDNELADLDDRLAAADDNNQSHALFTYYTNIRIYA